MGALKSYKCSKGHVLRGANLYVCKNGSRQCRKCALERGRKFRALQKKRKATAQVEARKKARALLAEEEHDGK